MNQYPWQKCMLRFGVFVAFTLLFYQLCIKAVGYFMLYGRLQYIRGAGFGLPSISLLKVGAPFVFLLLLSLFIGKRLLAMLLLYANAYAARAVSLLFRLWYEKTRPDMSPIVTATGYSVPGIQAINAPAFLGFVAYLAITEERLRLWQKIAVIVSAAVPIFSMGIRGLYIGAAYTAHYMAGCFAVGGWLALCVLFHYGQKATALKMFTN